MKARGVFAIFSKVALACAMYVKDIFSTVGRSYGSGKSAMGRDAFLSVSAPRCHNQKKIYRGFAK
jgi:hypothetical protein